MGLRKGSVEGSLFGKGIIFPKEGGSHLLKAPSPICLSTLSLFRLPRRVKIRLEKIQQDFLRGGGNLEKKIHLVS